jgi:hypothetical protein
LKTPGILVTGELESEWARTASYESFMANRSQGALLSWVEEANTGHTGTAEENLVLTLMAEAIRLRYPQNQVPTATSGVTLAELDETDGWLIDMSVPVGSQTEMASYSDYTGDHSTAGWLTSEGMANVFRAFATYDRKVSTSSGDVLSNDTLPWDVTMYVNTSAVPDWSRVELFDYTESLQTIYSSGPPSNYVVMNFTLHNPGVHGLYVVLTHADGVTTSISNPTAYVAFPEPSKFVLLGSCVTGWLIWFGVRSVKTW